MKVTVMQPPLLRYPNSAQAPRPPLLRTQNNKARSSTRPWKALLSHTALPWGSCAGLMRSSTPGLPSAAAHLVFPEETENFSN